MKSRQVLVLGATGMLGSMVVEVLSKQENFSLHATVRSVASLQTMQAKYPHVYFHLFDAEQENIGYFLQKFEGLDWILNAIGIIKPFIHDNISEEVKRAISINALFPHQLSEQAEKQHTQVIQIATDCVFSGTQGNYLESDTHDALDIYGKTKSLGEAYGNSIQHLRCSIIGPETGQGKSLLE